MNSIEKFKEKSEQLKLRNLFNKGATQEQIIKFETTLGLKLPKILHDFYSLNNGGCFADNSWSSEELLNPLKLGTVIWNSNYFLSLEEIIDAYHFVKFTSIDFQQQEKITNKRLIPIFHTSGQENLVWDATDENSTKILDAFHEVNADEWEVLYKSFDDLFLSYLTENGDIETIV